MWAIAQVLACIASLTFCTYHDVQTKPKDYGHLFLSQISTSIPHALTYGLVGAALLGGSNLWYIFSTVYAPAMFIKATLMPLTIMPDANPQCVVWHPIHCLTRNDMLPSGHMILALCAALTLPPWGMMVAGITGVCIIASRMHYTVDVILSAWIIFLLKNKA
jgi:hypothetical protein